MPYVARMRLRRLVLCSSLLAAACASDGRRDGETCSAASTCTDDPEKSYELCTTDGSSSCRFLASDGTSFDCATCASCASTLMDVVAWCSGGTSANHGATLSITSAEWYMSKQYVIVQASVTNQSSADLTAQPPLFSIVDDARQIVTTELGTGPVPSSCSGSGMVAKGGTVTCSLSFATMTPATLRYSDGAHAAEASIDRASIGTYVPPQREDTAALCADGKDNDRNGLLDCNDSDGECCNLRADCKSGSFCCSLSWYKSKNSCGASP